MNAKQKKRRAGGRPEMLSRTVAVSSFAATVRIGAVHRMFIIITIMVVGSSSTASSGGGGGGAAVSYLSAGPAPHCAPAA